MINDDIIIISNDNEIININIMNDNNVLLMCNNINILIIM